MKLESSNQRASNIKYNQLFTNYNIVVNSYQSGPDTYLLQLRDVDFPVRLREYMKVAGSRGPATYIVSDENGYDWRVLKNRQFFCFWLI